MVHSQANQSKNQHEKLTATIEELPSEVDLPIPEVVARLKNRTPPGDVLITKIKDPPVFMMEGTLTAYSRKEHPIICGVAL